MEIKHNACRPKIKRMSAIAGWKSLGDRDVLDQTRAQNHVTVNETLAPGTQTAVVLAQLATGDTTQHDIASTQVCAQVRCLMIALYERISIGCAFSYHISLSETDSMDNQSCCVACHLRTYSVHNLSNRFRRWPIFGQLNFIFVYWIPRLVLETRTCNMLTVQRAVVSVPTTSECGCQESTVVSERPRQYRGWQRHQNKNIWWPDGVCSFTDAQRQVPRSYEGDFWQQYLLLVSI